MQEGRGGDCAVDLQVPVLDLTSSLRILHPQCPAAYGSYLPPFSPSGDEVKRHGCLVRFGQSCLWVNNSNYRPVRTSKPSERPDPYQFPYRMGGGLGFYVSSGREILSSLLARLMNSTIDITILVSSVTISCLSRGCWCTLRTAIPGLRAALSGFRMRTCRRSRARTWHQAAAAPTGTSAGSPRRGSPASRSRGGGHGWARG